MLPPEPIRRAIEERLWPGQDLAGAVWFPSGGGLSDASVWRVERSNSVYAVRRWWGGIDPRLVGWIADSLATAAVGPCRYIASPLTRADGDWPYQDPQQVRWEAAEWKAGKPLGPNCPPRAVEESVRGLAEFHARVRPMPPCPVPKRPAWEERVAQLARWLATPREQLTLSVAEQWPELANVARRLRTAIAESAERLDRHAAANLGPRQTIHGDTRPDHFLLSQGKLTGLIDFGTMRTDSVLVDVARLAGELALGDQERLNEVVSLYETAAKTVIDRAAVAALDSSGAVLSAINWTRWLSDPTAPRRDPSAVRERLRSIAARLPGG